jgi:hypothetical protein
MRSIVLAIIVIELCCVRGFPSKRQVKIALSNQSSLFGVIPVLFWYYCGIVLVIS